MPPTTQDALLIVAAFSRYTAALEWGRSRLVERFGPIAFTSEVYSFHHTDYYTRSMGSELLKQLIVFERLVPLDSLPERKHTAIALERALKDSGQYSEDRPLNLDPGLLNLGKFMLATTKDNAQRVYLRDGIFAEVTLFFHDGEFRHWPWTYADYREDAVRAFLLHARDYYKQQLASAASI
jgi:hypothetical protein